MKFEYYQALVPQNPEIVGQALKDHGDDGWECFYVLPGTGANKSALDPTAKKVPTLWLFFKRQAGAAPRVDPGGRGAGQSRS